MFIPALREKSYNSIVTELDLLGYLEMKSERGVQRRTITFDPTSRNDGKNTCNLPSVMEVPTILDKNGNPTTKNDFISTRIIAPYLTMLQSKKAEQEAYNKVLSDITGCLELVADAASANDFIAHIDDFNHVGSSKMKASMMLAAKAKELGLIFNKETIRYMLHYWILTSITLIAMSYMSVIMGGVRIRLVQKKSFSRSSSKN